MSGRRILVDDNIDLAENLAEILVNQGFQAGFVSNPRMALEAFEPGRCAAALVDVRMPGIDGVELYGALHGRDPALPGIAMTACATDNRLRDALAIRYSPRR